MACVPILSKRKQYRFEAIVGLHSLISVPQYSPRVEIRHHTVTWNTEHRFMCQFRSNAETTLLEPNILKISIRMETKGGKSFRKVGYVIVDLACFTALGNAVSRRRYILEAYDEKHKRLDNSLLLVSFSMRQLFGDTCFRPPPENLSNCLIEPPDLDETRSATVDSMDSGSASAERASNDRPPSSIDRILADTYAIPRKASTQSPVLGSGGLSKQADHLQTMWRNQPNSSTLSEQLTRLLDQLIIPRADSPRPMHPRVQPATQNLGAATNVQLVSDRGDRTENVESRWSSSATSTSTSPSSTPTESPARCPPGDQHMPSCSSRHRKNNDDFPPNAGDTEEAMHHLFNNSIQCHSLPHHASLKPQSPPALHFATDSGLLLPSRRRKIRPAAADLIFPPPTTASHVQTRPAQTIPTTSAESHSSSGYQSHSRQSSLESQTVAGTKLSPILSVSSGYSVKNSGSGLVPNTEHSSPTISSPPSSAH